MAEFFATTKHNIIDPKVRASVLTKVYTEILSWPEPREKGTDPAAERLGRETTVGSETRASASADTTPSTHPVQSEAITTSSELEQDKRGVHNGL
jgi:hypothetical protein